MPELLEKTLGSAGALAAFCLIFLWVVDLALIYKLSVPGIAAFTILVIAWFAFLKHRRLKNTRQEQLRRYRTDRLSLPD